MFLKKLKLLLLYVTHYWYKNRQSKILFYHDVHLKNRSYTSMSTPIELLEAHLLQIRKSGFEVVNKITSSEHQIQICFDDGFRGIYDNRSFFVKESIFPTIFLAISLIGQEGYLTNEEILELQELGFNFESHAYSHKNLVNFSNSGLQYELKESKRFLESLLKKEITEICFPIGYFSKRVYNYALNSGYKILHSSIPGNYFQTDWKGVVNRNLVQFYSPREVKYVIFGALLPFRNHYKKRQYLKTDE